MHWLRRGIGIVALAAMMWLVFFSDGKGLIMDWLEAQSYSLVWILVITSAIYALALAVPFLPAVELGWMVMAAFGKAAIFSIWLATPIGLLIAFSLGHWMREWPVIARLCERLQGRLNAVTEEEPNRLWGWVGARMARHPYWVLVALVNLPGNWMIGGGGGIGILAGASGLYHPLRYFLVLIPATSVVAVLMLLGIHTRTG